MKHSNSFECDFWASREISKPGHIDVLPMPACELYKVSRMTPHLALAERKSDDLRGSHCSRIHNAHSTEPPIRSPLHSGSRISIPRQSVCVRIGLPYQMVDQSDGYCSKRFLKSNY